jgi:hypothetical protein
VGFEDEGSVRPAPASLPRRPEREAGEPSRLAEQSLEKDEPEAISCHGPYVPELERTWLLRFVDGPPVSGITARFLRWCCTELEALGKRFLLSVWDDAGWHVSHEVRRRRTSRDREVDGSGCGV